MLCLHFLPLYKTEIEMLPFCTLVRKSDRRCALGFQFGPSGTDEVEEFVTYTAHHQGVIETFWFRFWGALIIVHFYIRSLESYGM